MSIASSGRTKIGQHLSYPLKFNEIEASLGPVCSELAVEVTFWSYRSPRLNEVRDRYRVLEVSHVADEQKSRYRVMVSPVPRHLRAVVHALLMPTELERVSNWLLVPRTPSWRAAYHALRVSFSPSELCLLRYEHDAI